MRKANNKYYVVWEGRDTGVFSQWDDVAELVNGYSGARYQAFDSEYDAVMAFRGKPSDHSAFADQLALRMAAQEQPRPSDASRPMLGVAVDGACAGNPGPMEYRCVRLSDGAEIFHVGPLEGGTNNIAEYLAIIHAAALLAQRNLVTIPIYSDSVTAQSWVRRGRSNTTLIPTMQNERVRQLLDRADRWLATHHIANPILKWDSNLWGEIPADFNRK